VSFLGHRRKPNGPFKYHKPDLNKPDYDVNLGIAQLTPQDGRIKLAFDLHSQEAKAEHIFRMESLVINAQQLNLKAKVEKENKKFKEAIEKMTEFDWGGIFILDTDPARQEYTQVVYGMGTELDSSVISESESVRDAWSKRFVYHGALFWPV
jgi:hypothetical protein